MINLNCSGKKSDFKNGEIDSMVVTVPLSCLDFKSRP